MTAELRQATELEEARRLTASQEFDKEQRKAGRAFSFAKFLREAAERGLEGLEKEVSEEGAKEFRDLGLSIQGYAIPSVVLRAAAGQNYGTPADGGNLIQTASLTYLDYLREKMVITSLGATFMSDLVGTIPFVTDKAVTASWLAEAAKGTLGKTAYTKAEMKPNRCFVGGAFTKDLLRQTSVDVEMKLRNILVDAHAVLLEKAAINGSGSSNEPRGILNTTGIGDVAMGVNGGAIDWKSVVALETAINGENANRGAMAYLMNNKVWGALKTTAKDAGSGRFLLEGGMLNGYKAEWSNLVPSNLTKGTADGKCSALIFGNFNDLYIGQWGGIDVVVDPYTLADTAEVRIILNAYNDVLVARPKSFAAIKDITTEPAA